MVVESITDEVALIVCRNIPKKTWHYWRPVSELTIVEIV